VNEKKTGLDGDIVFACILLAIVLAGILCFIFQPGRSRPVDDLAAANARRTEETIGELRRTVSEQQSRIDDLESSNQRLEEYLIDAGRICESLTGTVETSGTYTASAIEVSKRLRTVIKALESWYDNLLREYPGIADVEFSK